MHFPSGVTFGYFFIGLGMLIASAFLFRTSFFWIGIPLCYAGFCTFLSVKGVFIDPKKKEIKSYIDFFVFKLGEWKSLAPYNSIRLKSTLESQQMHSRGSSLNVQTKAYTLYFSAPGQEKIEIKEFSEYTKARDTLHALASTLQIEAIDQYALAKAKAGRTRRR